MRKIYSLLFTSVFIISTAYSQTTLVNSDFETGDLTNWQLANAATNKWIIGSATAAGGTRSAYVSNDNGVTNAFTNNVAEVSHIYVQINVPASETAITLNFDWKGIGEHGTSSTFDYLRVSVMSAIPVAGTLPATGEQIPIAFNAQPDYTNASLVLPATLAGAGIRYLVFSWRSDASGGTNPPAAIDNVLLTSAVPSPLTGTKTIGPGGDYSHFGKAIADLNAHGVGSGGIIFNVTPGTIFNETPLPITATGTPANAVTFQKNGAGTNPLINATGSGNFGPTSTGSPSNSSDGVIVIAGGDYITFDGIDVKSTDYTGTTSAIEYGYLIRNASATDGAKNNTIKNVLVTLNRSNSNSVGILQTSGSLGVGVNATNATGANTSNQYYNIQVQDAFSGIFFNGGTSTAANTDAGNVLSTEGTGQTIIGASYVGIPNGDIGGGGTTFGVRASNQTNISISFVTVRNITTTNTFSTLRGIYVTSAQGVNNNVFNNQVYGIRSSNTSNTSGVNAFELDLSSGTHTLNAFNNFAYDITSAYTSTVTSSRQLKGILLGSGIAGSIYNISYNSVRIDGSSSPNVSSVCLELGGSTPTNNIRNNILANFTGAQSGLAVHSTIRSTNSLSFGAGIINNNDYYIANATNGYVGIANTVNKPTLADWKGFTGQDNFSISVDPAFNSPTDLHISPTSPNVDSKATPLSITTDIDGDIRHATTPDIGADEYTLLIGNDIGVLSLSAPGVSTSCYSAAETVQVFIKNYGITTVDFAATNVTVSVTASNGYSSSFTITSGTLTAGSTLLVTLPATINMTPSGTYTFNASTNGTGSDVNPANDALSPSVSRTSLTLGGEYTVGAGGDYPTLSAAVTAYNTANCFSGSVTFKLTASYTSSGETFPITINANPASGSYLLNIQPAAGVAAVISGSSPANALIRVRNKNTTIDGLNTGGASLLLENTGTTSGSTVIWNSSNGADQGASNNTYRNLSIKGGVSQNTSLTSTFGIVNSGATLGTSVTGQTAGNDNDNITITGNNFTRLRYGIISRGGSTANPNLGNVISNNIIGPAAFGPDQIGSGGIAVREEDGITITQNEIRFVGGDYNNSTGTGDKVGISLATDFAWTPTSALIKNATVTRNSIHDIIEERTYSAAGIVLAGVDGTNATNNVVANNMLHTVKANGTGSDQTVGIGIAAGNGDKVVYNSIYLTGDSDPTAAATATALPAFGVAISSLTAVNLTLKNNIIWNDLTSSSAPTIENADIAIPASYAWGTGGSDYNDLYIDPSNPQSNVGHIGTLSTTPAHTTLAQWQTASSQDANSISIDPVFLSPTNLHISPTANAVDAKGTPLSVTNDFDGETRHATTPDIGADEFLLVVGNDLGVEELLTPVSSGCYTNAETVSVLIKNYGSIPVDFGTYSVTVTVTGSNGYTSSFNLNSGTIAAGATLVVTMPATIDMAANMSITFNAYTTILGGDVNPANDALSPAVTRTILTLGGEYTVGAGGDYTNLTAAVADFNVSSCIISPVTFKLTSTYSSAGETFPITINANAANGTNPLTIRPDNGVTAIITGTSATSIIKLNGADYVVIDGSNSSGTDRSLTIENLSTGTTSTGVWLASPSVGNGSTNNTIKNSILQGNSSTTTMSGIHVGGNASISLTAAGTAQNNNNTITNNLFMKTQYGLVMFGYNATVPDDNNIISDNNFGTATTGEGFNIAGIWADRQNSLLVTGNDVQNVKGTSTSAMFGIRLLDFKNGQALKNKVHNLRYSGTSTSARVYGIGVSSSSYVTAGNPSDALIANNFVYDVTSSGTSTTWNVTGMLAGVGYGDKYYYNSIHLTGQLSNGTSPVSAAFANGNPSITGTSTNADIRNNIFSIQGVGAASGTGPVYAYYTRHTTATAGTTIQDHNDLIAASTNATNHVGFFNSTSYPTLAAWRAATSWDNNSISRDPGFTSSTDLHILPYYNWVDAKGTPLSVTDDIDGDTRDASTPDMGADEYVALYGNDAGVLSLVNPPVIACYGAQETVTVIIKNFGSSDIDMSVSNIIVFVTATPYGYNSNISLNSGILPVDGTLSVDMPFTIDMTIPGNYVFNASTSIVGGDINPTNDNLNPPVTKISATLNGVYNIGAGADFDNLTDAINTFNVGCITGPVTFQLLNTYSSAGETFPLSINVNASQGTNPLTIRPAAGVAAVVTGSSPASALIRIRNSYTTIDGIKTGGASLSLQNTGTTAGSTVIWISSNGAGQGASNNTIKNLNIMGGVDQNTATTATFGIVSSGATLGTSVSGQSAGNDNDNITIQGNTFTKLRSAIISRGGSTANPNLGTVISNNIIGPTAFGPDQIGQGGIAVREEDGVFITNNEIRFVGGDYNNTTSGTDRVGITLATDFAWSSGSTSAFIKNATVTRNRIHDLVEERTFSAVGIIVSGADGANPTNNVVANNMIYNLLANGTGGDQTIGIGVSAGNGDKVVFNSIYLTGDTDPEPAASTPSYPNFGVSITSATPTNLTLKNNIIFNDLSSSSFIAQKNADINIPTVYTWGTGGSDYNDLYVLATNTQSNVGERGASSGGTPYATLPDWQAATGQDMNSVFVLPNFISPTNLHLNQNTNCQIDASGIPIPGVTTDYDNQLRHFAKPDIGADEITAPFPFLAGTSGLKECSLQNIQVDGTFFYNSNCELIAKVFPAGGSPVTSTANVCVTIDPVVMSFNAQPYAQRHYDIEPAFSSASATASVTLYFTQTDFDNYNAANGLFPDLPTGPGDAGGIARLNILQYHGTGTGPTPGDYPGPSVAFHPADADIIWNGSFGRWEITFPVTGFSGFFVTTGLINALPVTMEYFNGRKQTNGNLLRWKANCSSASMTFELQRSADGRNFSGITSINASQARCALPFDYTDVNPLSGRNYYRLKMTEADGHVYYSIIVLLLNDKQGFEIVGLLPTLVDNGTAILNVSTTEKTKLDIIVTDLQGRIVQKQTAHVEQGSSTINMNFTNLASGSYQLTGITPQGMVKTIRFVKQ